VSNLIGINGDLLAACLSRDGSLGGFAAFLAGRAIGFTYRVEHGPRPYGDHIYPLATIPSRLANKQ
jgi:hypothetical protein